MEANEQTRKSGVDWADPTVPVGNAPPMPRWPLILAGLAWGLWIVFLVLMTVGRYALRAA
jgi:hypothetical protein